MRDHRTERVMVAYPYGAIEPRFVRSLIFLLKHDHDHHDRIFGGGAYLQLATTNVAHGRNQIVRQFLDLPGKPDWLWFIDTDMDFGPDTLDRLVESADPVSRPILGGLCFALMKGDAQEVVPTLYAWTDDDPPLPARATRLPAEGVHPVAATGIFTRSKNYGELLTKLHDAEDRARSAGQTRELPAGRVEQIIDGLHARIPRRLTADLRAARAAAARAAVDPDPAIWAKWCEEFFDLATRRLVETRFADVEQRRAG